MAGEGQVPLCRCGRAPRMKVASTCPASGGGGSCASAPSTPAACEEQVSEKLDETRKYFTLYNMLDRKRRE